MVPVIPSLRANPPVILEKGLRRNNLDVLRLVAAVLVIISHSYSATGNDEPVAWLDPARQSWGHFGVLVFFSISGYLIAGSWVSDPSVPRFAAKRALRIAPGLFLATALSAWVIGPFVTTLSPGEYFSSLPVLLYPPTETLIYFSPSFVLPGIFAHNPMSDLNPSLWTLPIEVSCYVGLMVLMLLRLGRVWVILPVAVLVSIVCNPDLHAAIGISVPWSPLFGDVAMLAAAFFVGTALYLLRDRLPLRVPVAAAVLAVALLAGFTPLGDTAAVLLMPYVVLTVGLAVPAIPLGAYRGWDLSYGTYVLAFPIQQTIVHVTRTTEPWVATGIALPIVLGLAALSWRFVERPALLLAHRLPGGRPHPLAVPTVSPPADRP